MDRSFVNKLGCIPNSICASSNARSREAGVHISECNSFVFVLIVSLHNSSTADPVGSIISIDSVSLRAKTSTSYGSANRKSILSEIY